MICTGGGWMAGEKTFVISRNFAWIFCLALMGSDLPYVARVRFGIRVRVQVRDSAIFEKGRCGCGGTRQLKNIFIYIFNILLSIFFHIIQTYTKFKSNSR